VQLKAALDGHRNMRILLLYILAALLEWLSVCLWNFYYIYIQLITHAINEVHISLKLRNVYYCCKNIPMWNNANCDSFMDCRRAAFQVCTGEVSSASVNLAAIAWNRVSSGSHHGWHSQLELCIVNLSLLYIHYSGVC
jgi:hypothetical protein